MLSSGLDYYQIPLSRLDVKHPLCLNTAVKEIARGELSAESKFNGKLGGEGELSITKKEVSVTQAWRSITAFSTPKF